jgi:cyclic pyranopterin phosphate synthase
MSDETGSGGLSHLNRAGEAHMVDVGGKAVARLSARRETVALLREGALPKGDVLATARIAGIMGAKRTAELIPLCHPLALSHVAVALEAVLPAEEGAAAYVEVRATVRTRGPTGVEMEALTAASVAALTLYDMCKAVDREMAIEHTYLESKRGGRRGEFRHPRALRQA